MTRFALYSECRADFETFYQLLPEVGRRVVVFGATDVYQLKIDLLCRLQSWVCMSERVCVRGWGGCFRVCVCCVTGSDGPLVPTSVVGVYE